MTRSPVGVNVSEEFKRKRVEAASLPTQSQWQDVVNEDPALAEMQALLQFPQNSIINRLKLLSEFVFRLRCNLNSNYILLKYNFISYTLMHI